MQILHDGDTHQGASGVSDWLADGTSIPLGGGHSLMH
jgi:hypothetical protein